MRRVGRNTGSLLPGSSALRIRSSNSRAAVRPTSFMSQLNAVIAGVAWRARSVSPLHTSETSCG